jgi:hypothetical protein
MNSKIFTSLDDNHLIIIKKLDEISWFNIEKFDKQQAKTFLLLLKEVIDYFNENNIKYIKQYIHQNDLKFFKNSSYVEIEEAIFIITTPIEKFIDDMIDVLGIQKL